MLLSVTPLLALGGALIGLAAFASGRPESPLVAPRNAPPTQPSSDRGAGFVGASGIIEASTENIAIGTPVGGVVAAVDVRAGQVVATGQPLFSLDDRDARAELRTREAEAAAAAGQLAVARAAVREARADLSDREAQAARVTRLELPGSVSGEERSQRAFAADAARARLDRAIADVARLQAEARRARAVVAQVRTTLDRLRVVAPIPAEVLRVNVRPGEYAPANRVDDPLLVLGSTGPRHVRVDIDEADIPRITRGAIARIYIRGAPRRPLRASFVRIEPLVRPKTQLSGAGTERVDTRVLQIIYAVQPGDAPLYPGQQVDVFIPAREPTGPSA